MSSNYSTVHVTGTTTKNNTSTESTGRGRGRGGRTNRRTNRRQLEMRSDAYIWRALMVYLAVSVLRTTDLVTAAASYRSNYPSGGDSSSKSLSVNGYHRMAGCGENPMIEVMMVARRTGNSCYPTPHPHCFVGYGTDIFTCTHSRRIIEVLTHVIVYSLCPDSLSGNLVANLSENLS